MSDRIAVMNRGVVEQVASPRELYEHPRTAFVAGFIGTSNLVDMRVDRRDGQWAVMDIGEGERILAPAHAAAGTHVRITVRPEKIKLDAADTSTSAASHVSGTLVEVVYLGSMTQFIVDLRTGDRLVVHRLNDVVEAREYHAGDRVTLHWAADHSFVIGELQPAGVAGGAGAVAPVGATAAHEEEV